MRGQCLAHNRPTMRRFTCSTWAKDPAPGNEPSTTKHLLAWALQDVGRLKEAAKRSRVDMERLRADNGRLREDLRRLGALLREPRGGGRTADYKTRGE